MSTTMRAIVLDGPGPPETLQLRDVPVPTPSTGEVLIRVRAFGLNRSELHFRRGLGSFGDFPRIPGIEAVGEVVEAPGDELAPGTQVAALMGGMGRTIDGGYAEHVAVPLSCVIPFASDLPWNVLGAVPEMLQTAHGTLTAGLGAVAGETILVRGGTSSIGLAIAVLARRAGLQVVSTTRSASRAESLREHADIVVLDTGSIHEAVREVVPAGVDVAVELVGTDTLHDTVLSVRRGGTVCFTGMLSDRWTVPDFYPIDFLPNTVRLSAYSGEASDLPPEVLQAFLDDVAAGTVDVPLSRTYPLEEIVEAHRDMEAGTLVGKGVVLTDPHQS
ncbi:zinc-binding dehydrogenase [Aeromicrobium sp. CF4.19]|uniref:zinc-binding dehydrogenase n=1 Tax=Aeromicrobium sp. CF4.19 TaxID=3373082 RepID=UPI003EE5D04E